MNKEELLTDTSITSAELLKQVSLFSEEQLNTVPFEGSWTAGQVAEHLNLALMADVLYGATEQTKRQPDEKTQMIKDVFLNFEVKLTTQDFILPANITYRKDECIRNLESRWAKINDAVQTLDLSETCTSFSLPVFEEFTRLEWINLFLYHTQRHIQQLKKIYGKVVLLT